MGTTLISAAEARGGQSAYPRRDNDMLAELNAKLAEVVIRLHESELSEGQRHEMRLSLGHQLDASERLHRFPLRNSDEPAFRFCAN